MQITIAAPDRARVGEGPFWDGPTEALYWVDILGQSISSLRSGVQSRMTLGTLVGAAVPKRSGGFAAATREGFAEVDPGGQWRTRVAFLPDGHRMNDAKCDVHGRFWAGSTAMDFTAGQGALHVLSPDWRYETVLTGLALPNGLGWSPDGRTFYLVDTIAGELYAFAMSPDRYLPAERRVLRTFPESGGLPDGLTVDAEGCLWIAMWGAGRVLRLSPHGETLAEIEFPVAQPSSCVFGGPGLDVLYVTTAREGLGVNAEHAAGSVFAIRGLGVTGLPSERFAG